MRARSRPLVFVVTAMLVAALEPAAAETAAQTASRWGALGTWKIDCVAATSRGNCAVFLVVRNGQLLYERDCGTGRESDVMPTAVIGPDGSLEVTIASSKERELLRIVWVKDGLKRLRAISSQVSGTGEYRIKDGVFPSSGKPAPWQIRCD